MNKSLQIFLLGLVFLISGALGFVLEGILLEGNAADGKAYEAQPEPVVEETVSTIPVFLESGITAPERDAKGNFRFSARAEVESAHQLKYVLYKDVNCTELVSENISGQFTDVPPVASKTYYIRVQNMATGDWSVSMPVQGFVALPKYDKITKAELENLFNVQKDYNMAPRDFKNRLAPSYTIVANGMNENERPVSDIADVCLKIFNETWSYVVVEEPIIYDNQNRLKKLTIRVNY